MSANDAVALTRELLAFDTINPPGRERDCARHAGRLLEQWGFRVEYHEYAPGRTSLVARAGGKDAKAPLCLTGHLDTVALGARAWSKDPFAGETDGDRLYGRGSSDMKAGVAAILLAARTFANRLSGTPGVVLVLTAAEEGGCIGSQQLARHRASRQGGRDGGRRADLELSVRRPQGLGEVPRAASRASRRTARCRSSA